LTVAGFDVTGATCASGYVGTAVAAVCTGNSAAYVMSGCVNTCTQPTTAGYAFGSVNETALTVAGFDVTGATCASGYVGTAVAAVCTGNSAAYVMSGCNIIVTTTTTSAPASTATTTAPASAATTASPASAATTASPASAATTASPASAATTASPAKAAVDAGVQVTPNKMGILVAFLALFFIH
jgi:hypothetical protein